MQENLNSKTVLFEDRLEATKKLLEILPTALLQEQDWIIVAISAEAVEMAEYISTKLNLSYDVLFTEPILAPNNPECEIAMVSETEEIVIHDNLLEAFDINIEYVYGEAHRKYEEKILKYIYKYRKGEPINSIKGKNVLIIDQGCETGLHVLTSIKTAINAQANSVIFAVPMLPSMLERELERVVDKIYTFSHVDNFIETSFYYKNNPDIPSDEVLATLEASKHYLPLKKIQTKTSKQE